MRHDDEQRRNRNAKRWLWAALLVALLLAGVITYTSLTAPDPGFLSPQGTAPLQG